MYLNAGDGKANVSTTSTSERASKFSYSICGGTYHDSSYCAGAHPLHVAVEGYDNYGYVPKVMSVQSYDSQGFMAKYVVVH